MIGLDIIVDRYGATVYRSTESTGDDPDSLATLLKKPLDAPLAHPAQVVQIVRSPGQSFDDRNKHITEKKPLYSCRALAEIGDNHRAALSNDFSTIGEDQVAQRLVFFMQRKGNDGAVEISGWEIELFGINQMQGNIFGAISPRSGQHRHRVVDAHKFFSLVFEKLKLIAGPAADVDYPAIVAVLNEGPDIGSQGFEKRCKAAIIERCR